jgi:hypothetical protein
MSKRKPDIPNDIPTCGAEVERKTKKRRYWYIFGDPVDVYENGEMPRPHPTKKFFDLPMTDIYKTYAEAFAKVCEIWEREKTELYYFRVDTDYGGDHHVACHRDVLIFKNGKLPTCKQKTIIMYYNQTYNNLDDGKESILTPSLDRALEWLKEQWEAAEE